MIDRTRILESQGSRHARILPIIPAGSGKLLSCEDPIDQPGAKLIPQQRDFGKTF